VRGCGAGPDDVETEESIHPEERGTTPQGPPIEGLAAPDVVQPPTGVPPSEEEVSDENDATTTRGASQATGSTSCGDEPTGEAISRYTAAQVACIYACGAAAAVGCVAVSATCATGTVFTVGSVSIPCIVVIAAACGAVGGAGAVCGAYCVQ
jgi:hypothetical protein